jgi:hypothetical protein
MRRLPPLLQHGLEALLAVAPLHQHVLQCLLPARCYQLLNRRPAWSLHVSYGRPAEVGGLLWTEFDWT